MRADGPYFSHIVPIAPFAMFPHDRHSKSRQKFARGYYWLLRTGKKDRRSALAASLNIAELLYQTKLKDWRHKRLNFSDIFKRWRALNVLKQLSPEILRDIGLTEWDLATMAYGKSSLEDLDEIRRKGWLF